MLRRPGGPQATNRVRGRQVNAYVKDVVVPPANPKLQGGVMEWRRREASWFATSGDWTIELTPFVSKLWPNNTDSWVRKVHKNGSRKVRWMGAYQTLEGAKQWAERDLADPSAYFKTSWSRFENEPYEDKYDNEEEEEPNYG